MILISGQLSKFLAESVPNNEESSFVLIDRGARRHQYDAKLRSK